MKIIYPHGEATKEQIEEILQFAIEGRKRVKDQILRIDSTMADVKFGYNDKAGEWHSVTTLEEDEYPAYYHRRSGVEGDAETSADSATAGARSPAEVPVEETPKGEPLFEGHREFQENLRGVSYDTLLLPYLDGATEITIVDPYVRQFHQARNLMELIEVFARTKDPADEVKILLVTSENTDGPEKLQKQMEFLLRVKQAAEVAGITLDVKFDATIHDRSIVANSGWRINLGRGLDIFQFVANDVFDLAVKLQRYRQVKAFGVTYIREFSE